MQTGDVQLLADLRTGDPRAVEVWFQRYHDRLLRYVVQRITVTKDAEELVQETFMNCLKHLPLFRGNSSVWTWMCGIAKHEIADYFRKKYAKRALKTFPLGELLIAESPQDAHETAVLVKKVLSKMGAQSAELLQAKYVDSKKVSQIALELGKSAKAIESELFRARQEFKSLWTEYQAEYAGTK
jgi:RNA polymerase sigma-70 factor (ECF subfamily)